MKVILTADLPHVGNVGQVVEVANGYGRNYLIPRGLAILATPGNERSLAQQQKARLAREVKNKADAEALATQLQALSLSIAKKTGEGERLYGSVTSMDIADLLKARGVSLDRRRIVLDTPLKTLGTHRVPIRLHPEVITEVEVAVTKEA
ncbi:MAG: 50S ribosomal protein L9 [Candidatus Tectomicrobia bacterium]|nr:50S ribosomal protein L9 [Candidatus Tectomicrobia bacterium]